MVSSPLDNGDTTHLQVIFDPYQHMFARIKSSRHGIPAAQSVSDTFSPLSPRMLHKRKLIPLVVVTRQIHPSNNRRIGQKPQDRRPLIKNICADRRRRRAPNAGQVAAARSSRDAARHGTTWPEGASGGGCRQPASLSSPGTNQIQTGSQRVIASTTNDQGRHGPNKSTRLIAGSSTNNSAIRGDMACGSLLIE